MVIGYPLISGAELPPRARRILQGVKHRHDNIGTTSACAENTASKSCQNTI